MGNDSAKKLVKKNWEILKRNFLIAVGVMQFHWIVLYFTDSSFGYWLGSLAFLLVNTGCFIFFRISSNPTYGETGQILSPGADLSQKGVMDFVWDVIYSTWVCQFLTLISAWFWLLMLVMPIYGAIKIFNLSRSFGGMGAPEQQIPESVGRRATKGSKDQVKYKFVK